MFKIVQEKDIWYLKYNVFKKPIKFIIKNSTEFICNISLGIKFSFVVVGYSHAIEYSQRAFAIPIPMMALEVIETLKEPGLKASTFPWQFCYVDVLLS